MTDLSAFADDVLVDALLMELAGLLGRLIDYGETGTIDLRGMPLSASCLSNLEQRLGQGEITVQLDAAGRSELRETAFPGVWWVRHADEAGRIIAMLIEVTTVPDILSADPGEMALGLQRLPGCTHASTYASARGRRA
jgi:hydrogenase-1 operon protein HyaF